MADVSNSKSNERSKVKRPKWRVTKIRNKNWKNWFAVYQRANIGIICIIAEYRMDEQFKIANFQSQILVFEIKNKSRNSFAF